jgi:SAM-dependent methyltransferase
MNKRRYTAIFNSENTNWWYVVRRKLITQILYSVPKNLNQKILDIGCGTGRNLVLLSQFGNPFGIDIAPEAINFCQKRHLKNVYLVKNDRYPFPDKFFDLVTCFDVLEHVKDERTILSEINRVLKVDGHLIILVPAAPILWGRLDTDSHHYRRYTKINLAEMLEENGFAIKKISYYNYLLFLPILLVRLFQKTHLGKGNLYGVRPDWEPSLINKVLEPIFTLDVKSLKFFSPPFGVSLFAICKKH